MTEEIFDIVDKSGKTIGQAKRSEVHGNPSLIHQTVHCLVFNKKGDIYLQKRALNKDVQPGKWDTSVGGHMNPGETPLSAVIREAEEELNIKNADFEFLYKYIMENPFETELVYTFKTVYDMEISCDAEEISDGRFWKKEEIISNMKQNIFTPNFIDEWTRYSSINNGKKDVR